jgi:DNA-binding MarR family transcriptional regulator
MSKVPRSSPVKATKSQKPSRAEAPGNVHANANANANAQAEAERIAELMEQAGKAIFKAGMGKKRPLKPEAMHLTLAQMRCLWVLGREEPCTMRDLSRHMGVRPSTACELVDALVKSKMVSRESDPNDRRAVILNLAPKGRRLQDKHRASRREQLRGVIENLSADERRAIVGALETLSAVLHSDCRED